jgi:outer membrane protein insertion porin family
MRKPGLPVVTLVALVLLMLRSAPAAAQLSSTAGLYEGQRIVEIDVTANTKTDDETVKLIADVETGDTFSYELVERIKVDLVNSGLFKDVNVYPQGVEKGVRLTLEVKDKHSWVIAPTVYWQPGNKGGGFGFAENNLGGRNKKLLLYGQIATEDSIFIGGYLDPSLAGSRYFYWRAYTFLRHEDVTEYNSPDELFVEPEPERITTLNYLNGAVMLGINFGRAISLDTQIRGAYVFYQDPHWADGMHAGEPAPVAPDKDGWDVSTEIKLTRDKRANWYGIQSGHMWRLSYEKSLPQLGSDWDWQMFYGSFMWAKKIWSETNFVWKASVGYGINLPFQQEFTSGGVGLRGYRNRHYRGDVKGANTLELSVPFFKVGSVAFRGLAFWDTAYTSFMNDESNESRDYLAGQTDEEISKWRNGVGLGFRIYLRSIVMPLLGLDWGYGIEIETWQVYFAVGLTEL